MEHPRTPEKSASKEPISKEFEFYTKKFNSFLERSDESGRHITDVEKLKVSKSGDVEALNQIVAEKAGGAYKGIEYKLSKYRTNAFVFLSAADMLLGDPKFINRTNEKSRQRLSIEIKDLMQRIRELRKNDEPITRAEVERGVLVINELKQILEK